MMTRNVAGEVTNVWLANNVLMYCNKRCKNDGMQRRSSSCSQLFSRSTSVRNRVSSCIVLLTVSERDRSSVAAIVQDCKETIVEFGEEKMSTLAMLECHENNSRLELVFISFGKVSRVI